MPSDPRERILRVLDTKLAGEAAKELGVKTRTEAVHMALKEIVALRRSKRLMAHNAGKLRFEAHEK
jgi:Arc/MetJ family transcription regulator